MFFFSSISNCKFELMQCKCFSLSSAAKHHANCTFENCNLIDNPATNYLLVNDRYINWTFKILITKFFYFIVFATKSTDFIYFFLFHLSGSWFSSKKTVWNLQIIVILWILNTKVILGRNVRKQTFSETE